MQPDPSNRLGHLLLQAARRWNEEALVRVARETRFAIRPAHTALLPFLPFQGGIRATELAEHVGISKQAVGKLLRDLEGAGVLQRSSDPTDGRAVLFGYTEAGRQAVHQGLLVFDAMEGEARSAISDINALKEALRQLTRWLDGASDGSP